MNRVGNEGSFEQLRSWIETLKKNQRYLLIGPSGIGKTKAVHHWLTHYGWECMVWDSEICMSSKECIDRWKKLHQWKDMGYFQVQSKPRCLLVDELETLMKIDRNIPSTLLKLWHQTPEHIPCILVGQMEADKKIGDLRKACTGVSYWEPLSAIEIQTYLQNYHPMKISIKKLKQICQAANGSLYSAIQALPHASLSTSLSSQDSTVEMTALFKLKDRSLILRVLQEDPWIHPLKWIENANKHYAIPIYISCLKDFLMFDTWITHSDSDHCSMMIEYLSEWIFKYNHTLMPRSKKQPIPSMDFTKLLSSISTQKKLQRSIYEKQKHPFPISELGSYWILQMK